MLSLMHIAERNARMFPHAPAVKTDDHHLTHAEFARRSRRAAALLQELGLRRQDRFSVLSMNNAEFLVWYAAASYGRLILNTVSFRLAPPEIAWLLNDAAPRVLIFEAQYADVVEVLRPQLSSVEHYLCVGAGAELPVWARSYEALVNEVVDLAPEAANPDDFCCLMYTSGTTGKPKGVLHTNRSILRIAEVLSSELMLGGATRLLAIAPLFHMGATTLALAAIFRGGCAVVQRGFDAGSVIRIIERERITALHMVPTMVQAVLDAPELGRHDLSSLCMLMYAAAPMPLALAQRATAAFGPILYNGYGQTEINLITVLYPHQHVLEGAPEQTARLASVGQTHWQSEVRIVADDGRDCGAGEVGEVVARSQTGMAGYWNNSVATLSTVRDGWVHTGDVGYLDAEGFLFLVDRKKDVIISGGENVYSREVEDALGSHADVHECAVIGVPDVRWGEVVKAFVVLRADREATVEELIAYCRTRVAGYKCPKHIEFIDVLPRLPTGKVSKTELRRRDA